MHDPSDWSRREFVITALLGTGATAGCTARGQTTEADSHAAMTGETLSTFRFGEGQKTIFPVKCAFQS